MANADKIPTAVTEAVIAGAKRVVVDLSDVTFLDSSGVRALIQARQIAEGRLFVRGPRRGVRVVLEVTGIDDLIETDPTVDSNAGT